MGTVQDLETLGKQMECVGLPVFAWGEALDRVGGDAEYLGNLLACLLVDLEGHLRELREAAVAGNAPVMTNLARMVEEKASRVCAEALADAARVFAENRGQPGMGRIEAELERLQEQAASMRGHGAPPSANSNPPAGSGSVECLRFRENTRV